MKLCLIILSVPWYMFNGLEHTAILSHILTFITGSSSRFSTIYTTFYLTSLLQIYELKRRYETSHYTFLSRYQTSRIRYETSCTTAQPLFCRFSHVLVSGAWNLSL